MGRVALMIIYCLCGKACVLLAGWVWEWEFPMFTPNNVLVLHRCEVH
jgi:hypothetical protein